jgi:hypothetical protein
MTPLITFDFAIACFNAIRFAVWFVISGDISFWMHTDGRNAPDKAKNSKDNFHSFWIKICYNYFMFFSIVEGHNNYSLSLIFILHSSHDSLTLLGYERLCFTFPSYKSVRCWRKRSFCIVGSYILVERASVAIGLTMHFPQEEVLKVLP